MIPVNAVALVPIDFWSRYISALLLCCASGILPADSTSNARIRKPATAAVSNEVITARGTCFRGDCVSSARSAAASKPVRHQAPSSNDNANDEKCPPFAARVLPVLNKFSVLIVPEINQTTNNPMMSMATPVSSAYTPILFTSDTILIP